MCALVSPDGVAPSRMVDVSASVNLPSTGTSSPGWFQKNGRKTIVVVVWYGIFLKTLNW